MREYVSAVIEEARDYKGEKADTVFIGGGTPARLPLGEMERLIDCVRESIDLSQCSEFTVEVNPNSLTREKVREYASIGVNRISIGLQAAQEALLRRIGRTHSLKDFLNAVDMVKEAGICNINADMIYSLPDQTKNDVKDTANLISSLDIPHISAYSLILEEGTPLFKEAPVLPDDDEDRDMFYTARDIFAEHGIYRYEISNFARPGFECRHNLKYWRVEDYIGLGVAAHSCYNGRRSYNASNIDDYLCGNIGAGYEPQELLKERIMLGLRLREGVSMEHLPFDEGFERCLNRLIGLNMVDIDNGRLYLTDAGMDLQNTVVAEMFAAMDE